MTVKARQIQDKIHKLQKEFINIQDDMKTIQPLAVTEAITKEVSKYFGTIRAMVDEMERETLQKIKHSKKLQMYLHTSDLLTNEINPDTIEVIDEEVLSLNSKLEQQKYAYIIIRESYYKKLEEELAQMNRETRTQIENIKELESSVMRCSWDE